MLASEKAIKDKLMEDTADLKKISKIDEHVACAISGIIADSHVLIRHARFQAKNHWFSFNELMPVKSIVNCISDLSLQFSGIRTEEKQMSRPFGVSMLVGGVTDREGPVLVSTDPSGTIRSWNAAAFGAGHECATNELEKQYKADMTLKDACLLALQILRQVMEHKIADSSVHLCIIPTSTKQVTFIEGKELQDLIDELPANTDCIRID